MDNYLRGKLAFKGERGYSAYEIAVQEGFQGDKEAWLEQIGYEEINAKLPANIKDFGAVGDGVTDDTAAIQEAIAFVEEHNGILLFNHGMYKITNSLDITKPIKIVGAGEKGETATGAVYGTHIKQENNEANIFNFSGSNDYYGVEISNLRLAGNKIAINVDTTGVFSEFIFEKIHFNGGFEECIFFDKTGSIGRISDCDFTSNEIGINANTLVAVTISENNFWQNSLCHIKFGSCEDLRIMNNWFEKTVETGCSLLLQAPFSLNKVSFLNNEFRSTKTPIINYDAITNINGLAYIKDTKFENCRFSAGNNAYAIVVRMKNDSGVSNSNGNNSSRLLFDNCLFVNIGTTAIYTDYKWLYWSLKNCSCYSAWTNGTKSLVTGESVITETSDISGYKTNGVINLMEVADSSLIADSVIYKATDGAVKIFKNGSGKNILTALSGGTSTRPTENLVAGMMYYDTTLGKPIFYNGNKWTDGEGHDA